MNKKGVYERIKKVFQKSGTVVLFAVFGLAALGSGESSGTENTKEIAACEEDGFELYHQDGILIKGKYVDENSFWGTAALLYIENDTDKNIRINCDNMSINGFMVHPYFSSTIYAGKKAIEDITIMSTDLESNGITSVEDLEVNFHIYHVYKSKIEKMPLKDSNV